MISSLIIEESYIKYNKINISYASRFPETKAIIFYIKLAYN